MYCIVITTCENNPQAETLAKSILEANLAACVQLSDINSFYHWDNKIANDKEVKLLIKTKTELYDALEKHITTNHEYDIPEIIMVPIEKGSAAYLGWINQNTTP